MTGAAVGWVVILAFVALPLVWVTVVSRLKKRGIWAAGKGNDRRGGGGGGGCGAGGGCSGGSCGGGGCGGGGGD
jgi:hypothetical protein